MPDILALCNDMDSNPRNVNIQIKSMNSLISCLKVENDVNNYQNAFKSIENAIKANSKNEDIIMSAINLFNSLLDVKSTHPLLEVTNIFNQLMHILNQSKENPKLSLITLETTLKAVKIPRIGAHFSTSQFLQTLSFIGRLNSKSIQHGFLLSYIGQYLGNNMSSGIDEFLVVLTIFSRNFEKREDIQNEIFQSFAHLCKPLIMDQISQISLPVLSKSIHSFPKSYTIFKSYVTILFNSRSSFYDEKLPLLACEHYKSLLEDPESLKGLINVFSKKTKKLPINVLQLLVPTLIHFISDAEITKEVLNVTFSTLVSSQVPRASKLSQILTSILLVYSQNQAIVKRAAACIQAISTNPENDVGLLQAGAPIALIKAAGKHIEKAKTIDFISSALVNFIGQSGCQLNTPDYIKLIHSLIKTHQKSPNIVKSLVLILYGIVLSTYSFEAFLDLNEEKNTYLISEKVGATILETQLGNYDLIKATLLLKKPKDSHFQYVANAMNKYSSDEEILLAGLVQKTDDINAITKALTYCGEKAFRYSIQCLNIALQRKQHLNPPLVDFLLLIDSPDAVSILENFFISDNDQEEKTCQNIIAAEFKLNYPCQLPLAKLLSENYLWNIHSSTPSTNLNNDTLNLSQERSISNSNQEEIVILTGLFHSKLNSAILDSALYFVRQIGLTSKSVPYLFQVIDENNENSDIVKTCFEFISGFAKKRKIKPAALENCNSICISCRTIKIHKNNPEIVYPALEFLAFLTSVSSNSNIIFSSSLNLLSIIKAAGLNIQCRKEVCDIMSNISSDPKATRIMYEHQGIQIAREEFPSIPALKIIFYFVHFMKYHVNNSEAQTISHLLDDETKNLDPVTSYQLLSVLLDFYQFSQFNGDPSNFEFLPITAIINLLTIHSTEPLFVKILADLVHYASSGLTKTELLVALIEALKINSKNRDACESLVLGIQNFSKIEKHQIYLQSENTVNTFIEVIKNNENSSIIASTLYKYVKGRTELCASAKNALQVLIDEPSTTAISRYLLSVVSEHNNNTCEVSDDQISQIITSVLLSLHIHENSSQLCSELMPILFYASSEEKNQENVIQDIDFIYCLIRKHMTNVRAVGAGVGIISNISAGRKINQLGNAAPVVMLALRIWPTVHNVLAAGTASISNFAIYGKGKEFQPILPVLANTIQKCTDINDLQSILTAFTDMSSDLGEYYRPVTIELIKNLSNEFVSECLISILKSVGVQETIGENIQTVFDLINRLINQNEDNSAAGIINMLAGFTNKSTILLFQSYLSDLMKWIQIEKVILASAAAKCIYNITTYCPEIVFPYADSISRVNKTMSGEVLRFSTQIQKMLYGYYKRQN